MRRQGQLATTYSFSIALQLENLAPGIRMIYHRGFLEDAEIGVAAAALNAFNRGKVHLFQSRLGPPKRNGKVDWENGIGPGFQYMAVGR